MEKKTYTSQDIFFSANVFHESLRYTNTEDLFPNVVISAFALELLLKCLLDLEYGEYPQNTHDLKKLFDSLPPDTKNILEENFNKIVAKNPRAIRMMKEHPDFKYDLSELLIQGKDTFQNYRYAYDQTPNTWGLSHLKFAIIEYLKEKKPGWFE